MRDLARERLQKRANSPISLDNQPTHIRWGIRDEPHDAVPSGCIVSVLRLFELYTQPDARAVAPHLVVIRGWRRPDDACKTKQESKTKFSL